MPVLQGDVVKILNSARVAVVNYNYDAWGNILSWSGSMISTLGRYNPLTYRGYVYDYETNLYYLQSRYYNPETGRFLNADAFAATGQGFVGNNMFAYCLNNPINMVDRCGCTSEGILYLPFLSLLDGGLPFVDAFVAVVILGYSAYQLFSKVVYPVLIVIIDESSSVSSPKKEQDPTIPLPVTESKAKRNDDDVLVYRWAKHRNTRAREYQNLTPRPWSDDDGLSFSLVPTTTKENATTTLGALRDAGFICTVKGNHVSVMPAGGMAALDSWKRSYDTANSNPHELTLLLYGITW